jgi:uncharacterized protein YndB with AHSA1/START domain
MDTNHWTKFTKRIFIETDAQEIYNAWTTQEGLEKWFLRKAEFTTADNKLRERKSSVLKGDSYVWRWHGYHDGAFEQGKVLDANGTDFFQFTFTADCIVTVSIETEHGQNVVVLTQENIPIDENPLSNLFVACGEGWTFYLTNLKSILEGGIDLRNKKNYLINVINS